MVYLPLTFFAHYMNVLLTPVQLIPGDIMFKVELINKKESNQLSNKHIIELATWEQVFL